VEGYSEHSFHTEDEIGKSLLGGTVSTIKKRTLNLTMDIYVPLKAGKQDRPLLMLIHGGAFYVGDKSDKAIAAACNYFASLGYTTASINYRMGFQPTKASIERTAYNAVQDAHAALRFLLANAEKYKIDPNYIFVGGSSAGGITTLNLAFMKNENRPESSYRSLLNKDLGNIESVGKHNDITFKIKSIVNLWGAIDNLDMLKNSYVSTLSYHGTEDPIVPCNYDYPMQKIVKKFAPVFFNKMYGSKPIHDELKKLGYREKLVTVNIAEHNLWETKGKLNNTYFKIINDMKQFFYKDLVLHPIIIEHDPQLCQRYFISNTKDVELITWQCDGGFIIHNNEKEVYVIWRTDATNRKLLTSGVYRNGAAFRTEIAK
jgi:pimeloyl-ACP methyl ester carboxylesterase